MPIHFYYKAESSNTKIIIIANKTMCKEFRNSFTENILNVANARYLSKISFVGNSYSKCTISS